MKRHFARLGDRMLGALLRETEAGACVPEHGQRCSYYQCDGGHEELVSGYFDCYGGCTEDLTYTEVGKC